MIKSENELFTVLKDEGNRISGFVDFLEKEGEGLRQKNLALDLGEISDLEVGELLQLLPVSNAHRANGKSFVVVTPAVSIEDIPEELITVPTLVEAEDLIQMEEIERDLGF